MKIFVCKRNHLSEPGYNKTLDRYFCRECKSLRERKKYTLMRLEKIEQELIWDREFYERKEYEFIRGNKQGSEYQAAMLIDKKENLLESYIEEIEDICIELEASIS